MIQLFFVYSTLALFIVRVVLGAVFIAHGLPKIKNFKTANEWFASIGLKPGVLWGTPVVVLEVFGGAALILGFLIQPLAVLFAVGMLISIFWKMHEGLKLVNGYEIDLVLLALAIVLATNGGGLYALDSFLNLRIY